MPIRYYLQDNPVTTDPNDRSARIDPILSIDEEVIVDDILESGTTLTRTDVVGNLAAYNKAVAKRLAEGYFVNLPIANLRTSIKGVFVNGADEYDASRHTLRVKASGGKLVNQLLATAPLEKLKSNKPAPYIDQFIDISTQTADGNITPGSIGTITGEELKFNPEETEEGIFFVASNGTEYKADTVANRTEGTLTFLIPATLTPGNYRLEVRKAYTQEDKIRIGVSDNELTVAPSV